MSHNPHPFPKPPHLPVPVARTWHGDTTANISKQNTWYLLWDGQMPGGQRFILNMYTAASAVLKSRQKHRKEHTATADAALPSWGTGHRTGSHGGPGEQLPEHAHHRHP